MSTSASQPHSLENKLKEAIGLHRQGQLDRAALLYEHILTQQPNHANALQLLGVLRGAQGQISQSIELIERSLALNPEQPNARLNLGRSYLRHNQPDFAIEQFRRVADQTPENVEAWFSLGIAHGAKGQKAEAAKAYEQALAHQPDHINSLLNLAILYAEGGQTQEATKLYTRILAAQPGHISALNGYGSLLHQQGNTKEAVACYQRALEKDPYSAESHMNLGYAFHDLKRHEEALAHCEKAVQLAPKVSVAHNNLAISLQALGRVQEAEKAAQQAVRLNPTYANAHNNLGNALQAQGKKEEAAKAYRESLKYNPTYAMAYRNLGLVTKFKPDDQELIDTMEQLLASPNLPDTARMHLSFALGKAYGDLKQVDPSFTHYLEGNRLRRKEVKYDSAAIKAYFNEIKSIYTPDYAAQAPTSGIDDDTPIFILGQPRSGTTLMEQILASHPNVFGAEELHYMGTIANTFCHRELGRVYPSCMKQAKAEDLEKIGKEYLRLLRTHSADAKHITDKMPANFQYVGMILQSLPNARIIHCHRNPMDNCFSIFKYYFVGSINYAYDLKELGEYYLLYRDLMDHWHSVYPGRIFDLEYEEMTRDAENLIPKLVDYCGLPWDDACLNFHSTKRDVRTASAMQVRQPIYTSSVEAWRPYETHLKPLYDVLHAGGAIK